MPRYGTSPKPQSKRGTSTQNKECIPILGASEAHQQAHQLGSSSSFQRRTRSILGEKRMQMIKRAAMGAAMLALVALVATAAIATEAPSRNLSMEPVRLPRLSALLDAIDFNGDGESKPHQRPTQVHVALFDRVEAAMTRGTSPNVGMTVSWATAQATDHSVVRFGRTPEDLSMVVAATAACEQYTFCDYTSPWFHHVMIDGAHLEASTTYFYQCGDGKKAWSEVLTFTTPIPIGSEVPLTFGVIGDLGQTEFSQQTIRHLINEPNLTAILHAGDLSYADSMQTRWDLWGTLVEPLAATCPWMVSAGNHEVEKPCQADTDPFVAYQKRFRMPYAVNDAHQRQNLYYSFRVGMVHVVVLTPYVSSDVSSPQYQWLDVELARVDRALTPWVVVIMHGPWYNSNTAHQGAEPHLVMKHDLEDLLFEHHVDLVLSGHVHAYERSYPVYKEVVRDDGIVYVVLGDGGNREGLAPTYMHPKPAWSAFRQANYGFGRLHIANRTHALIEMYEDVDTGPPRLHDQAWLTTTQLRAPSSGLLRIPSDLTATM